MSGTGEETPWSGRTWGLIVGVALALLPMLVRLQSPLDPLPYWDGDPFSQEAVVIGLMPATTLAGDVVSLLGAALLLLLAPRKGWKPFIGLLLVAAGAWACVWHVTRGELNPKEAMVGGAWASGVAVAFALWQAAADRRVRILVFALIIGAVGLLAVKGLYQVAIEHPATVEAFRRDRDAVLARNGWTPDSAMAKAYERRLMQSEATGWFGFANVYASFAAMGIAAFGVLAVGAWRSWRKARREEEGEPGRWPFVLVLAGFAASAAALTMAGAKGGFAAAVLGLTVAVPLAWVRKRDGKARRLTPLIGPAIIALPLLAVVARSFVGERIGELSLLFRWFYMQGAARIFSDNWQHGVGPDGFQAAYALAKNPLSPEDVTSPHSLLWDWAACLGIGGVLWGLLLVWMSTRIGPAAITSRAGDQEDDEASASHLRSLMRAACVIAALGAMVAIPTQYAALLPEEALGVRIGGLIVWCVLSCGALAVAYRCDGWRIALAAGACVLLVHTQIEITGMWPQSCGLLLAMIAVAAANDDDEAAGTRPGDLPARWPLLLGAGGAVTLACVFASLTVRAASWQARLKAAHDLATPVRELRQRIANPALSATERADLQRRLTREEPAGAEQILDALPLQWPLTRNASQVALEEARGFARRTDAEGQRLSKSWAVRGLAIALGKHPALSWVEGGGDPSNPETVDRAFAQLAAAPIDNLSSLEAGWAATVCLAAVDWRPEPERSEWLRLAAKLLARAAARDPYNPAHPQRLMDVHDRLGNKAEAAKTAKRLLEVDTLQRLDRNVRGLNEKDRARAERIANTM